VFAARGSIPERRARRERKASLPDEFPDRRLPAIDAGPDQDPFEPPELPDELIDELLAGARTPEELTGPEGLLHRLTKRLVERRWTPS